jgi:hypothetical protein
MHNISRLEGEFNEIIHLSTEIMNKKTALDEKLKQLKEQYNELVKHNSKKIFLFCLDSFYFQYKVLHVEMEQFHRMCALIHNRIYGDYYKLFNIILMQCKENNIQVPGLVREYDQFPIYKDLEPFLEYKIEDVIKIHADILAVINEVYMLYVSNQKNIHKHNDRIHAGFSITSFINTLSYENVLIKEQIGLYSNYMAFYHNSQKSYLTKLLIKMDGFIRDIEDEVLINHRSITRMYGNNNTDVFDLENVDLLETTDIEIEHLLEESAKLMSGSETIIQNLEEVIELHSKKKSCSQINVDIETQTNENKEDTCVSEVPTDNINIQTSIALDDFVNPSHVDETSVNNVAIEVSEESNPVVDEAIDPSIQDNISITAKRID